MTVMDWFQLGFVTIVVIVGLSGFILEIKKK